MTLPFVDLSGPPGDAGRRYAAEIADLLDPGFIRAYVDALHPAIGFSKERLAPDAMAWLQDLPDHVREEVDGMAAGAGLPVDHVAAFLYADIAPRAPGAPAPPGPMCSALVAGLDDASTWVGRNCDWLTPTLMRGTAAVHHALPNRIPVLAVGIRGDIDVDTGMNAERLWLHLHTMHAPAGAGDARPRISWLFWAREALETCADLDQLDAFIARTRRDRGVLAIAVDGKTNEAAVFECAADSHVRHDVDPARPACVTNHPLARPGRPTPNPSGTLARLHALRTAIDAAPPRRGPDDMIAMLAREGVEMRQPRWVRTIYSAVAKPQTGEIWFAHGLPDKPAASTGAWTPLRFPR